MAGGVSLSGIRYIPLGATSPVLDGVSLEVARGECVGIVGVSGCGKSTLCQVLAGMIPHRIPGEFQGSVRFPPGRSRVGMVFQNPDDQLFAGSVTDEIAFGPRNLGCPEEEVRCRLQDAMTACDLDPLASRAVAALSMGQKQRVALASMLAMRPDVLLLDEPACNVDASSAERFLAHVTVLRQRSGMAVVLVDHDLARVRRHADRVLRLAEGVLAPCLETDEGGLHLPAGPPRSADGEVRAAAERVRFAYGSAEEPVLQAADLGLRAGEAIALLGPNGAGKSTLAKHFIGLLRPQAGRVTIGGMDIRRTKIETLAASVGYAFQNPDEQLFAQSVQEEVTFGPQNLGWSAHRAEEAAHRWLDLLGCAHLRDREPLTLSFGEKRRVSLAAAVAADPDVVILDEPTAALDGGHRRVVARLVDACKAQGKAVLVLTHDAPFARAVCEWQYRLVEGRLYPGDVSMCRRP